MPECRAYELVSPGDAKGTQLYPGRPQHRLRDEPLAPRLHGSVVDPAGIRRQPTRLGRRPLRRHAHPDRLGLEIHRPAGQGRRHRGGPRRACSTREVRSSSATTRRRQHRLPGRHHPEQRSHRSARWTRSSTGTTARTELGFRNKTPISSNAPYVWRANGEFVDRWPTNLRTRAARAQPVISKGASTRVAWRRSTARKSKKGRNFCPGEVAGSAELNHFAFSTEWNIFAPGGQLSAPGSVYDNDTGAGTVTVASKFPFRGPNPRGADRPCRRSAGDSGPLGQRLACPDRFARHRAVRPRQLPGAALRRHVRRRHPLPDLPRPPLHAGKRRGHIRRLAGARRDLRRHHGGLLEGLLHLRRTADQRRPRRERRPLHVVEEGDEEGHPLVLVSKGDNPGNAGEPGQSDSCIGGFSISGEGKSKNCDVITYSEQAYCQLTGGRAATAAPTTRLPPKTATSTSSRRSSSTARGGSRTD